MRSTHSAHLNVRDVTIIITNYEALLYAVVSSLTFFPLRTSNFSIKFWINDYIIIRTKQFQPL
jgi:hypothetical protein